MRRVTLVYNDNRADGLNRVVVWKCLSASWGADSRNVVMYDASLEGATAGNDGVARVLVPLTDVLYLTEDLW